MSHENDIRLQTLHETNHQHHSSGENLDPELYQLQIQLAAIQEQQRVQTFMIKQFQQQLKVYQDKHQQSKSIDQPLSSSTRNDDLSFRRERETDDEERQQRRR